jgi:signal transduction protein with GAF and PtsI domain
MFAAREVALGAATLMAAPEHKPSLVAIGVAVDGADTAASAIALRSKSVPAVMGVALTALSLGAVVTGVGALGQKKG